MASTRELWILLRARDEASRVVHSFSKNVRTAALAAQAAQKSAEAAAVRQRAQMLRSNGAIAQQIRAINGSVVSLEKQARAQTAAAAKAREYRAEQMKSIDGQVRANNKHAASLERQARALTLAAAMGDEQRNNIIRVTGATNDQVDAIDRNIAHLRKRAATLNAEAAVARSASATLIASLQNEQTGLDGSIRSHERRAASIRAEAAVMRNQAAQLKSNLDSQVRGLTLHAAALDKEANAFRRAANEARKHDIAVKKTLESLGKISEAATVAAFSLGAIGVGGLIGLADATKTAVEYERQVRSTLTQTDKFQTSIEEIGQIGRRVANEIGVSFESIQPGLFDIFSSMDVSVKDSEKLLRSFSKAAVAGQTDIQDVSRATIGILNAFHKPASDVNKVLDVQFQLVKLGIGTYEEWNQRIGLVTPSAVRANQSLEMMAAALATSTRMGISAARSATAVSRAMDALSNPKSVKNMEKLGIKVREANGKLRPMNKILRELRDVLMKMPQKDRVGAILEIFKGAGGTIEARRFLQNILLGKGNLELFDSILERTTDSAGSMEEAYKTMADSVSTKTQLMVNKWKILKEALGRALIPKVIELTDRISGLLDKFNALPERSKKTIATFLLWGSVIAIVAGALFAVIAVAATAAAAIGTIGGAAALALAGVVLLPAAILLLAYALKKVYDKSEPFRNFVSSIGDLLSGIKDIVVDFGKSVWNSFKDKVLPPLRELWATIETFIIPALTDFLGWIKDNIIPKLKEAANIVKDWLGLSLEYLGWVIENIVIPGLKDLAQTWKDNKDDILPYLQILGQVAKLLLIVAGIIVGVVIIALASLLFWWRQGMAQIQVAIMVLALVSKAFRWLGDRISDFWHWLKSIDWRRAWRKLVSGGQDAMNALVGSLQRLPAILSSLAHAAISAFLSPFRGLSGAMGSLGRNAIGSFVSGILGGRGGASSAGASIAHAAYIAAKNELGVKSPSKKFKAIGKAVVQGFVNGINGTRASLISAMNKLSNDVMASLKSGKASHKMQAAWRQRLKSTSSKLLSLEAKRAKITSRLTQEQTKLDDMIKARAELVKSISDKLSEGANLSSLEGGSVAELKANLQDRLTALRDFQQNLLTLSNKGLSKEAISQLAQAGVESAGDLAKTLVNASQADIAQINQMQNEINKIAGGIGNQIAGQFYDAGIKASQGLIKGLQSQQAAITKQMKQIADALVKAIKKALGIKSPSRVFMNIGKNTALGYIQGYAKQMRNANMHGEILNMDAKTKPATFKGFSNRDNETSRQPLQQNFTINTQEINPRLHAAQLGWELESRG